MRIASLELTKYVRVYVVIIICYVLFLTILVGRIEAKNFMKYGTFDLEAFKAVNHSFAALFISAIPFTIMLNICNEFSNGYALKLISNGLARTSYCAFKFTLAAALSIICTVLYALVILALVSIERVTYFDWSIFISSLIQVLIFSMFFSSIAVSVALLGRSWQSALLFYYGYVIIEGIIVLRFGETFAWAKYVPVNLATSIFELKAVPEKFVDYLLGAGVIIPFCLAIVWCAYHFFKKADL
jgi:hypothetical protein